MTGTATTVSARVRVRRLSGGIVTGRVIGGNTAEEVVCIRPDGWPGAQDFAVHISQVLPAES